ncbi:MAG: diguanylate cyclase [Actinomycetota bacterium]
MNRHPRLERQLRRLGLSSDTPPDTDGWQRLLDRLNAVYHDQDQERYLLDRSIAISSREMRDLHESLARREAEQSALRRIATAVARGMATREVFDMLSLEVAQILGVEAGRVLRYTGDGRADIVGVWGAEPRLDRAGLDATNIALGGGIPSALVLQTGRPSWIGDYAALMDRNSRSLAARGLRSGVAAPIRVGPRLWGAVAAMSVRPDGLPQGAEEILTDFTELAGLAISNAETRETLARRAATDPLTGLANHRELHERLASEVRRALRHDRPLSLVLLDIDRFKPLNDTYGHQVGDAVLVEVSRRLTGLARMGEVLGRVGGEEFAWILPETPLEGGFAAAERARRAIGGGRFPVVGNVTVSAGVCDLEQAGSPAELVRLADGALYWAKHKGRNSVVMYAPGEVQDMSAAEQAKRLERDQRLNAVRLLARAVDARDDVTQRHSERVADLSCRIAEELGWRPARVNELREAALVHDVGKLGVPESILLKRDPLTEEDWAAIRTHAALGAEIVSGALSDEQASWVRHHHERWGGGGYPEGIAGAAIPDGARIIALADAWDAMTGARPYHRPRSVPAALEECIRHSGTQFWPRAVEALAELASRGDVHGASRAVPVHTVVLEVGVNGAPVPDAPTGA